MSSARAAAITAPSSTKGRGRPARRLNAELVDRGVAVNAVSKTGLSPSGTYGLVFRRTKIESIEHAVGERATPSSGPRCRVLVKLR